MLPRADVDHVRTTTGDLVIDRVEHVQDGVDPVGAVPLSGSDDDVSPGELVVVDATEVQCDPVSRPYRGLLLVERLDASHPHGAALRQHRELVVDADGTPGERAGDHGARALGREHPIDPQTRTTGVDRSRGGLQERVERRAKLVESRSVDCVDTDDGSTLEEGPLDVLDHLELGQLPELVVDQPDLGEYDQAVLHAEYVEDAEMLLGLWLPSLGGGDHEHAGIDGADPGEHVLQETDVTGHVDEGEPPPRR